MSYKRGQVTIFIIIAILIIGGILLVFVLKQETEKFPTTEADRVYSFVETCIEGMGNDAIYEISKNGGYFLPAKLSTDAGVPYYFTNRENHMPNIEKVEKEISEYIDQNLRYCINNFTNFPDSNITYGEIITKTQVRKNVVVFDVEWYLTIKKGESSDRITNFNNIQIPSTLDNVYTTVYKVIQDQLTRDNICLTCISKIAERDDISIELMNTEEGLIFSFRDENLINEFPLVWNFINKYD